MIVRLRPLAWTDRTDPPRSSTGRTVIGYGRVFLVDADGYDPAGWYYCCGWDHGDEEPTEYTPCDSLEHGKECVEASYLVHLKPAFVFVEGDE